ncbi:MAG: Ni/Fe-hydrogenase cytochrome b subunit [Deltaproteobacteria bacterium]|nr:Ni/Fe-hydrogenase cytochrome b subunit [Deltaproteobacteria bacterium]
MSHHTIAAEPIRDVRFFTRGVYMMLGVIGVGAAFGIARFFLGLESVTNLDDRFPWGLWIAVDVATGVALAAGGFTTSALVHIFHKDRYLALVRPALLTAMLGYTFVGVGLMFDLGRYYNIWHPVIYWQGNSVLFEVGICVVSYLTVLYIEFLPIVVERFKDGVRLPGVLRVFNRPADWFLSLSDAVLRRVLFVFIILGVVLSCMHQSSLGALMLIAPTKTHALWFTPILPMLFLASAIAVGFPMVIFESMIASKSFGRKPEMDVLGPLARYVPIFLGLYLAMKIVDMVNRETFVYLTEWSVQSGMFLLEIIGGVIVPIAMFLHPAVRRRPLALFAAAMLVVLGVALNRINVFLVAYHPPYTETSYFPAIGEFAITAALIATLALVYRFVVMNFPVIVNHAAPKPLAKAGPHRHEN